MFIKPSTLTVSFFSILGTLALATPSRAALINFSTWNQFGDVFTPSLGQVDLSSNALQNDDFPALDSNFNFSTQPAIDSITLEASLGLLAQSLDPDPVNFVTAFEGSGLQQQYTFSTTTTLSFDWTFLTNDVTRTISGFNFDDYAFIALDDTIVTLASTNSSVSTLAPSSTNYSREVSGTYTRVFSPGTYRISLGVLDIGDNNSTSALMIGNATQVSQSVPEPSSLLGFIVPVSFVGVSCLRRRK